MNNLVALDVGVKRIGVARANGIARIAEAKTTLMNDALFQNALIEIIAAEQASIVVVGLPRNLSGDDTAQTAMVRQFVDNLDLGDDLQIILYDEAVSSVDAEANLRAIGKPYKKEDIDAEAARIILQNYLESQSNKGDE